MTTQYTVLVNAIAFLALALALVARVGGDIETNVVSNYHKTEAVMDSKQALEDDQQFGLQSERMTTSNTHNNSCPTWYIPEKKNGSISCTCGNDLGGIIKCNSVVGLLQCYCMSSGKNNTLTVGACLYSCTFNNNYDPHYLLPRKASQLSKATCEPFNREGQLCGKCKDGFAPPVYSYQMNCVKCEDYGNNWVKYIAAAFLPLTVFYLLVITFRISVTSGPLNAFILFSQTLTAPAIMRYIITTAALHSTIDTTPNVTAYSTTHLSQTASYVGISLFGIWNLDYFRLLYTPFCLRPNMTTLQALTLDYIIAVYPLILVLLTFLFVELRDRNFRLIVWLWRPFHRCFVHFKRNWNIRTSLVEAFATFLLLSYVKFLSVSTDLLFPVTLYDIHGETLSKLYLYYDGSIEYFGDEHIPYALLALVVLIISIILPLLLLCLYPCRCFQRCLNHTGLRYHALHTFMDAFQGCYKDGTNGTRDCRYFAGAYLAVRIALYTAAILTAPIFYSYPSAQAFILIGFTVVFTLIQPYKSSLNNKIDIIILFSQILLCVAVSSLTIADSFSFQFKGASVTVCYVSLMIPILYVTGCVLYWMFGHRKWPQRAFRRLRTLTTPCYGRVAHLALEESLPDRLVHAEEYEQLLPEPVADEEDSDSEDEDFPTY